jgi:hypothetical protein
MRTNLILDVSRSVPDVSLCHHSPVGRQLPLFPVEVFSLPVIVLVPKRLEKVGRVSVGGGDKLGEDGGTGTRIGRQHEDITWAEGGGGGGSGSGRTEQKTHDIRRYIISYVQRSMLPKLDKDNEFKRTTSSICVLFLVDRLPLPAPAPQIIVPIHSK